MEYTRCPHLGSTTDSETCFSFPTGSNACYRFGNLQAVDPAHQSSYCLSVGYAACPVFQAAEPDRLLRELSLPAEAKPTRWRIVFAGVFVLTLLIASIYLVLAGSATPAEQGSGAPLETNTPGAFLVFIDGTPVQIGTFGTLTPESLLAEGLDQFLNVFRTRTPTPFMPLPTGTPFTPSPTSTASPTATATVFIWPTSTLFVFPTPVFYTPTASATYLIATYTPLPTLTFTPSASSTPTVPVASSTPPVPTPAATVVLPTSTVTPLIEPTAAPYFTPTPSN